MTQVTVTMTFDSAEAAAAFLAGKSSGPAPTTKADAPKTTGAASSSRTAEAGKADAPAKKELDFDKDVVNGALLPYSKKASRDDFAALMKKYSVAKVPELKAKPDVWQEIIDFCTAG